MSTAGEGSISVNSKATTVPLPRTEEGGAGSTATPRPEQLDAEEAVLPSVLRLFQEFRSQRPRGVDFDFDSEPGPHQPAVPVPLQSAADALDFKDWLRRPEEWETTATWAWGLPVRWYSALQW
jgi:hypothetical protein